MTSEICPNIVITSSAQPLFCLLILFYVTDLYYFIFLTFTDSELMLFLPLIFYILLYCSINELNILL